MRYLEQDGLARRYLADDGTMWEIRAEAYGYFAIMEFTAAQALGHYIHPALDDQVRLYFQERGYELAGEIGHRLEEPFLAYSADGELLGPMCRVISEAVGWPPAPEEPPKN